VSTFRHEDVNALFDSYVKIPHKIPQPYEANLIPRYLQPVTLVQHPAYLLWCLGKRQLKPAAYPDPNYVRANPLKPTHLDVFSRALRLVKIKTFDEYLSKVEAFKRSAYKNGWLRFHRKATRLNNTYSVFQKEHEKDHRLKEYIYREPLGSPAMIEERPHGGRSRIIFGPSDESKSVLGYVGDHVGEALRIYWEHVYREEFGSSNSGYLIGLTPDQVRERYETEHRRLELANPGDPIVKLPFDFNGFDGHNDITIMQQVDGEFNSLLRPLLARLRFNLTQARRILQVIQTFNHNIKLRFNPKKLGLNLKIPFSLMRNELTLTVVGTVGSGYWATSGYNTSRVIRMFMEALKPLLRRMWFGASGDDTGLLTPASLIVQINERLEQAFTMHNDADNPITHGYGYSFKVADIRTDDMTILSKVLEFTNRGAVYRRQIDRMINTGCYSVKADTEDLPKDVFNTIITQQLKSQFGHTRSHLWAITTRREKSLPHSNFKVRAKDYASYVQSLGEADHSQWHKQHVTNAHLSRDPLMILLACTTLERVMHFARFKPQ